MERLGDRVLLGHYISQGGLFMYEAHGEFTIKLSGSILQVSIIGAWNLETALAYQQEVQAVMTGKKLGTFAMITDINQWDLFTPDVAPIIRRLVREAVSGGLTHEAVIHKTSSIKLEYFKTPESLRNNLTRKVFSNTDEALIWLENNGYYTD